MTAQNCTIRPALPADLPALRRIYDAAKAYMDASGNPSQWKPGYPSAEAMAADIAAGELYVICTAEGAPHAAFAMIPGADPTYAVIEGAWLRDAPYAALHRVASDGTLRGVVAAAAAHVRKALPGLDIRIDTHADNLPMQKALAALGFAHCGTIYLANGDPRLAYQLVSNTPCQSRPTEKEQTMQNIWDELYAAALRVQNPRVVSPFIEAGGVAAAIRTAAGNIYTGVCIDTACGLGMCAERSAIAAMLTAGESTVTHLVAVMPNGRVGSPCGACREMLMQLDKDAGNLEILTDLNGYKTVRLAALVPDWWGRERFDPK